MSAFADRLGEAIARHGPLCVGLDPFPERIPALFGAAREDLAAVRRFCEAIIARCAGRVAAVKPQLGLFEAFGPAGYALAHDLCRQAREAGLIVILDAKRGDIGTTAAGYARAALGPAPAFDADCVTVSAFMGLETLEPFFAWAESAGKGVAVLVRTSNPGAADIQELEAGGEEVWLRLARALQPAEARLVGAGGWSSLMAVIGATAPEQARRARALLPRTFFLVPGFGAQGASARDAMAGAVAGAGVLVNASRSVLYPPGNTAEVGAQIWEQNIDEAIADANAMLREEG